MKLKLIKILLVVLMMTLVLSGCGSNNTDSADQVNSETASTETIYDMMPNTALNGVINPEMADRASINKALPKTPKDPNKIVIGWTEMTLGNPWFVAVIDGAKKTAENYGYDLKVQVADGDVQKQSSQIDSFISLGVDVIVMDPVDIQGCVADVKRAVEAGIPVIAVGTAPSDAAPIVTTFSANPYGNGFEAGIKAAQQFDANQEVNAGVLLGLMGNGTSESRVNGMISGFIFERNTQLNTGKTKEDAMLEGFNAFQKIKDSGTYSDSTIKFNVVAWGEGQWTVEGGLKAAETMLAANKDTLNLFLADNDFMGTGCLKALDNIGMKGDVVIAAAADGFKESLDLVKSGDILCTGANNGTTVGVSAVELIHKIFAENFDANDLPVASYFPSLAIDASNVNEIYDTDPSNPFFKDSVPEVLTIPQLKEAVNK